MTIGLIGPQAQQYMHDVTPGVGTVGYLPLLEWVRGHIAEQHAPPYQGWECCVCTGNADGHPTTGSAAPAARRLSSRL